MKVLLSALLLSFPFTASAAFISAQNVYQFDGYFNVGAESQVVTIETQPLSSNWGSFTVDQIGSLVEMVTVPTTITYPSAPSGAKNVQTFLMYPGEGEPVISGFQRSFQVEPLVTDCGGVPCDYKSTEFVGSGGLYLPVGPYSPTGEVFDGVPGLQGQTFDLNLILTVRTYGSPLDRSGYNSRTTVTFSGPNHYKFNIIAATSWETAAVPEPGSIALAGLGLVGLTGAAWRRSKG